MEALNAALLWRNKQTGGILDEESETGVKGLNISRRKSKDGQTLYYLSVYIKRGSNRIQAMRALKKPINKVIWDAARIIAEARAKYDGEDEQEVFLGRSMSHDARHISPETLREMHRFRHGTSRTICPTALPGSHNCTQSSDDGADGRGTHRYRAGMRRPPVPPCPRFQRDRSFCITEPP